MIKAKPFKQSKGYCGPASLKIILSYYGIDKSEKYLAKLTNTSRSKGCYGKELVKAGKKLGFKSYYKDNCSINDLKKLIKQNIPVIIDWFSPDPEEGGHYSIVVGFERQKIILIDPYFGKKKKIRTDKFLSRWFDFENDPPKGKSDLNLRRMIVIHQ